MISVILRLYKAVMRKAKVITILGSFLLLTGCATTSMSRRPPAWVNKGTVGFPGDKGEYFYGRGIAMKSLNPIIAWEKADHRARVNLSKGIDIYVASFLADFMEERPDYFNPALTASDEFTKSVTKEISETVLRGCEIYKRWRDEEGTAYSLARMPRSMTNNAFMGMLERDRNKIFSEIKAEEALRKLDEELKKRDIREKAMWEKINKMGEGGEGTK